MFLVHHIATADAVFRELSALLRNAVAVFTTKHDATNAGTQTYSATFSVGDLEKYPIIVVTHEFYMGIRGHYARQYSKGGLKFPRAVTFIDERVNEIAVYDLDPLGIEGVLQHVQRDSYALPELRDSMLALEQFKNSKRLGDLNIETSAHDKEGWKATVDAIGYLRSEDAARYWRSASAQNPRIDFGAVFGFATAMADHQAFIARQNKGKNSVNFVGYDRALPRLPGMVFLDATADIDGVTKVCPWRTHAKTPPEYYDRLEVIHVPSVSKGNIRRWLREPGHLQSYVDHIRDLIRDLIRRYVAAGQKVLVVCTKDVVRADKIDGWSEHMVPFLNRTAPEVPNGNTVDTEFTEGFAWSLDGRQSRDQGAVRRRLAKGRSEDRPCRFMKRLKSAAPAAPLPPKIST